MTRQLNLMITPMLTALATFNSASSHQNCDVDTPTVECLEDDEKLYHTDQCKIYMAESTIPHAGLGTFTAIDRHVGETIGDGDVMIPISDHWYHLMALGSELLERNDRYHLDPTANFVWFGPELGMHRESAHPFDEDVEYVLGYAPGLDAVINCNLALDNVDKQVPQYDFLGLHRSTDPGVGAFTPYHACKTVVSREIPAGGELFKHYGDDWFTHRIHNFGKMPLTGDYPKAEKMIRRIHGILEKGNVPEEARRDLWTLLLNLPWEKTRTMNAIPQDYKNLDIVAREGIRAAIQPQAMRTIEWLEKNGRCADNIVPKPSSIKQAGRGAFATRFLPKGKVITGTPMLFLPSSDFLKMYQGDWLSKAVEDFDPETVKSYQLLSNYCWHHEESSIYLCPYGPGINYVNHNKTTANVRLQWAQDGHMNHNASLLEQSPAAMYRIAAPKLHLDVVATRDIQPGEELFYDYGDAWEKAWLEHVQRWNYEKKHRADYISARDWNEENPKVMLRTEEEQESEPYPDHFELHCLEEISEWTIHDGLISEEAEKLWAPNTVGIPCRIMKREEQDNGDYWYFVEYAKIYEPFDHDDEEVWEASNWVVREAMQFVDVPYTNDLFLDEVFRHPIGFPNEIFPDAWRGVYLSPLPEVDEESEYFEADEESEESEY